MGKIRIDACIRLGGRVRHWSNQKLIRESHNGRRWTGKAIRIINGEMKKRKKNKTMRSDAGKRRR